MSSLLERGQWWVFVIFTIRVVNGGVLTLQLEVGRLNASIADSFPHLSISLHLQEFASVLDSLWVKDFWKGKLFEADWGYNLWPDIEIVDEAEDGEDAGEESLELSSDDWNRIHRVENLVELRIRHVGQFEEIEAERWCQSSEVSCRVK